MQKGLRRPMFYIGLVIIAIGTVGLFLPNTVVSDISSKLFTIIGFVISFAQVFFGFPLLNTSPKTPNPPSTTILTPRAKTIYSAGGISLIFGGALLVIIAILELLVPSFMLLHANRLAVFVPTVVGTVGTLITGICIPIGLPALHMRQADKAGKIGLIGLIIVMVNWLANDFINSIYLAVYGSFLPYTQSLATFMYTFGVVLTLFVVLGNILLGLAIIRASIFPAWMGFVSIIVGSVNLIALFPVTSLYALSLTYALGSICNMLIAAFYVRGGYILYAYANSRNTAFPSMPQPSPVPSSPMRSMSWGYLIFNTGKHMQLVNPQVFVGRTKPGLGSKNPEIDLTFLPEGNSTSHLHAVLEHDGMACIITDLNSLNGTFINGKRLGPQQRSLFNDRDILSFGNVRCTFRKA